jgi:hypothetical protein
LSSEQVAAVDAEFRRDLSERRALHRRIERADTAFRQALADGDDARATDLGGGLVDLQARQNVMRSRVLLRMSWVLNADQRAQLKVILSKRDRGTRRASKTR